MSDRLAEASLRSEHDMVMARQLARRLAQQLGFSLVDQTKLVTAASELARNALIYGGGGELKVGDQALPWVGGGARLFRDGLNCPNALFLDGSVSSLFAPNLKRADALSPMGPIVAVTGP